MVHQFLLDLAGLAIVLFWADYTPVSAISAEAYRIVVSPTLPTIPFLQWQVTF